MKYRSRHWMLPHLLFSLLGGPGILKAAHAGLSLSNGISLSLSLERLRLLQKDLSLTSGIDRSESASIFSTKPNQYHAWASCHAPWIARLTHGWVKQCTFTVPLLQADAFDPVRLAADPSFLQTMPQLYFTKLCRFIPLIEFRGMSQPGPSIRLQGVGVCWEITPQLNIFVGKRTSWTSNHLRGFFINIKHCSQKHSSHTWLPLFMSVKGTENEASASKKAPLAVPNLSLGEDSSFESIEGEEWSVSEGEEKTEHDLLSRETGIETQLISEEITRWGDRCFKETLRSLSGTWTLFTYKIKGIAGGLGAPACAEFFGLEGSFKDFLSKYLGFPPYQRRNLQGKALSLLRRTMPIVSTLIRVLHKNRLLGDISGKPLQILTAFDLYICTSLFTAFGLKTLLRSTLISDSMLLEPYNEGTSRKLMRLRITGNIRKRFKSIAQSIANHALLTKDELGDPLIHRIIRGDPPDERLPLYLARGPYPWRRSSDLVQTQLSKLSVSLGLLESKSESKAFLREVFLAENSSRETTMEVLVDRLNKDWVDWPEPEAPMALYRAITQQLIEDWSFAFIDKVIQRYLSSRIRQLHDGLRANQTAALCERRPILFKKFMEGVLHQMPIWKSAWILQTLGFYPCNAGAQGATPFGAVEYLLNLRVKLSSRRLDSKEVLDSYYLKFIAKFEEEIQDYRRQGIPALVLERCLNWWIEQGQIDRVKWISSLFQFLHQPIAVENLMPNSSLFEYLFIELPSCTPEKLACFLKAMEEASQVCSGNAEIFLTYLLQRDTVHENHHWIHRCIESWGREATMRALPWF